MLVDIHTLLEKNPVTKAMLKQKFGTSFWDHIMDL